jgi:dihydrodipicolinate synthase/N-acetylneuraminate lyase
LSQYRALSGVLPVVQTPFAADGEIDFASLAKLSDWVLEAGAQGLTTGMVSEILRLSTTERVEHAEVVIESAKKRNALSVVSCGAESTHIALELAQKAEAAGASALMANPPTSVDLDDEGIYGYFAAIFDATSLPVVIQDASGYVGRPFSIDVQVKMLDRYGDRVYFKPEADPVGQRLSALRDASDGRARILDGSGGSALVDSYHRGIVGTMPGADLCRTIVRIWQLLTAGNAEGAYLLSSTVTALIALQKSLDAFVAVEKHLLKRQGVIESTLSRGPAGYQLDYETKELVDSLFDRLTTYTDDTDDAVAPATSI